MPEVSLIVPVLNDRAMLLDFIEHVKAQSHKNVGVYIIDGGSTDGSEFYATHRYTGSAPKGTVRIAEQRNLGTKISNGTVLIHTDCDIRFQDSGQLGRIVEQITGPSFFVGSTKVGGHNGFVREMYRRYVSHTVTTFMIIKRDIFEMVGGFRRETWHDAWLDYDVRRAGYTPILINETVIHTRPLTKNVPIPQRVRKVIQ